MIIVRTTFYKPNVIPGRNQNMEKIPSFHSDAKLYLEIHQEPMLRFLVLKLFVPWALIKLGV